MKIVVIGGVAAGTKAAAKLKREDRSAEVTIFQKGKDISYAGCGLPYYVGNIITQKEELIVNTPEKYEALTGVQVKTEHEVTGINREEKTVAVRNLKTQETESCTYDKLVIASGASPFKPPVPGVELKNVFYMRTPEDAVWLKETIQTEEIKKAVVAGGGFIGLEIAENLKNQGIRPIIVEMADTILPGFDPEMCHYAQRRLAEQGIMCLTGTKLEAVIGEGRVEKVQTSRRALKADLVVISAGIRPNTGFLKDSGLVLAANGAIVTDEHMRTNDPDIYAAGDCVMVKNRITEKEAYSPMGSSANMEGRVLAQNIAGTEKRYKGVLGTAVVKLPQFNAGRTGLTEAQAKEAGFDPVSVVMVTDDKAHYYPQAGTFCLKMIADKAEGLLLGAQVFGQGAVDKIVDIAATALTLKARLTDLENMDLAYAPPFSTAIHPFTATVNVLLNKINGVLETISPAEYENGEAKDYRVVDTGMVPSIANAAYLNLTAVNGAIDGFGTDEKLLLVCNKGRRAYMLQNRLKFYGYKNTRVLEGGAYFNEVEVTD